VECSREHDDEPSDSGATESGVPGRIILKWMLT
jgi:hypothetical protein